MPFWLLTLVTQLRKIISERWRPCRTHVRRLPQSSATHLLTFLVAQLQFLREWKLSDRRLYEVFEHRLLIWGNPKERNRRQISKTCVLFAPPCIYICSYSDSSKATRISAFICNFTCWHKNWLFDCINFSLNRQWHKDANFIMKEEIVKCYLTFTVFPLTFKNRFC